MVWQPMPVQVKHIEKYHMILSDVLKKVKPLEVGGSLEENISGVNMDSRLVKPGDLFVAVKGTQADGHAFIGKALENGAKAILVSEPIPAERPEGVTFVRVADTEDAVGKVATQFYGDPSSHLTLVGVTGTNGKTTTTSMATHIFMEAGTDPTVMIGGTLPLLHSGYRVGQGDTIILESCEYCNSFLNFFPTVAVILNVEEDHLDFFKDLADIEHSFHAFADLVPQRGYIISNADDAGARDSVKGLQHPVFTFAVQDRTADCVADNVSFFDGCPVFDVVIHGEVYAHVELKIPGKHNILNTLAAASAAYVLGLPGEAVSRGLETFHGAGRRMEHKGTYHGAEVYDDYAHHPGELHALLTTARTMGYQRVICAFQPHTYSRTKALFSQFVEELKLPDVTVLAEIYAAREQNDIGISSQDLAREIPGAIYCSSLEKVTDTLASLAQPGDLILTVGAGDIFRAGEKLLERA